VNFAINQVNSKSF